MPNKKISELTEVTSIIGSDVLAIVNSGVTKKIKAENLAAFVDPNATLRTLSAEWQSTYTTVQSNSALWDYRGTDLKALSADWVGGHVAFTNLVSNSAAYLSGVDLSFLSVSANWDSVYSTVQSNSASWDYQGTDLKDLSANWESTYTTVNANSASWGSGSGGSYVGDLSANWESTYTTVLANSASWNYQGTDLKDLSADWVGGNAAFTNLVSNSAAYLSSVDLSFLSVSANWDSVYNSVASASANWDSVYSNVASNSALFATIDFANSKFFALSGGLISGSTRINGNVTIFGDLSSTGTQTFANTIFATTSSLSVVHVGSGPAVWVGNNGSGDIASFYDIDQGVEVFHIGGANGDFPNVGVKVGSPNKDFTVKGEISATGDIWTTGRILSGGQELLSLIQPSIEAIYSTVNANSSTNWNYQGTDLKSLSASWTGGNAAFTNLVSNSALYLSATDLSFLSVSANWNSVYSTVNANSAINWNYQGTDLKNLSAGWVGGNTAFTNLVSNSAAYLSSVDLSFLSVSADWNSVYSTVQSNSATAWNYQGTDIKALTSSWVGGNSVYSNVQSASANYVLDGGNAKGANILIGTNDNFNLALETSGVSRLTILSSGNVGINEAAPEGKLHVTAGSAGSVTAQTSSVGVFESGGNAYLSLLSPTSHYAGVVMGGPTNPYGSYISWNHDNLALKLGTNHTGASIQMLAGTEQEAVRIASSGNVGIGTTSPSEKLTVSGNISASGNLYGDASLLTNAIDSRVRDLSGNWQSTLTTVSSNSAKWESVYSSVAANSASYATSNFVQSNFLPLSGGNVSGVFEAGVGSTTLFVSSGIVGINTEFPNHSLTVVGNISSSSIIYSDNGNSNQWNSVYTTVQTKSATEWDNVLANSYTRSNFLPLSGGTVSGSISASGVISASASNIRVNVVNDSTSRIFTDADNNRVVHIDTTTTPLCAIFPSSLSNGFNVAIMNTGTNNLVLSAAQLNSAGTIITTRYGGAFVYKDSNNLFAVGRLV